MCRAGRIYDVCQHSGGFAVMKKDNFPGVLFLIFLNAFITQEISSQDAELVHLYELNRVLDVIF